MYPFRPNFDPYDRRGWVATSDFLPVVSVGDLQNGTGYAAIFPRISAVRWHKLMHGFVPGLRIGDEREGKG